MRISRFDLVCGGVAAAASSAVLAVMMSGSPLASATYFQWPGGRIPIGITLSGLQDHHITPAVLAGIEAKEAATKRDWYGNMVRLQIDQNRLVGSDGSHRGVRYMHDIRVVTDYALRLGLTVVLNDQSECPINCGGENAPTWATRQFWSYMLRYYKSTPQVVFDLFNEPRNTSWSQWREEMQALVDYVRSTGARNQLWVEGIDWGSTLAGMPSLLQGNDIVYTFHHPGSPCCNQVVEGAWYDRFGWLASRGVPVIDAEFAGHYVWADAGHSTTHYLNYLLRLHVGMLAWTLQPGSLNLNGNLASVTQEPWGDGAIVRSWLARVATLNSKES